MAFLLCITFVIFFYITNAKFKNTLNNYLKFIMCYLDLPSLYIGFKISMVLTSHEIKPFKGMIMCKKFK